MEKVIVEICMGTTCFVMGGSGLEEFVDLLDDEEKAQVEVRPSSCVGLCKDREFGKAPYAIVNGVPVSEATVASIACKVRAFIK